MRSIPTLPRLTAILATAFAAAACGGSSRPGHQPTSDGSQTAHKGRLEQVEHEASLRILATAEHSPTGEQTATPPSAAQQHRATGPGPHVSLPPPDRPYAAGPLTAVYRATLKGGAALIPPGPYPHASGRVTVKVYGHTETCWLFIHLHGVTRPRLAGIALGANGAQGLVSFFTTTFTTHGCQTGIPASTLKAVHRDPHGFAVIVEDHHYVASLAGEL